MLRKGHQAVKARTRRVLGLVKIDPGKQWRETAFHYGRHYAAAGGKTAASFSAGVRPVSASERRS